MIERIVSRGLDAPAKFAPTLEVRKGNAQCGSPGLGGLRTARLSLLDGLLDYEDTRLKTSSRVWMGLYLAWKAS